MYICQIYFILENRGKIFKVSYIYIFYVLEYNNVRIIYLYILKYMNNSLINFLRDFIKIIPLIMYLMLMLYVNIESKHVLLH